MLNPVTAWPYGCPSLILFRLARREPVKINSAILRADWLDGRSLGGLHLEQNCFVGGSHTVVLKYLNCDTFSSDLFAIFTRILVMKQQHVSSFLYVYF
jgi:hypothetical protein